MGYTEIRMDFSVSAASGIVAAKTMQNFNLLFFLK